MRTCRTATAAHRIAAGHSAGTRDIILKAMDKNPDKRFQSAHEFRKALLKVGMVHVRAYRRLKAIRREKDKAALSLSPTWRREEEEVLTFAEQLGARLEAFFARKKTALTAIVAGVAVLSLATTCGCGLRKNCQHLSHKPCPADGDCHSRRAARSHDPATASVATLTVPASASAPIKTPDNSGAPVVKTYRHRAQRPPKQNHPGNKRSAGHARITIASRPIKRRKPMIKVRCLEKGLGRVTSSIARPVAPRSSTT